MPLGAGALIARRLSSHSTTPQRAIGAGRRRRRLDEVEVDVCRRCGSVERLDLAPHPDLVLEGPLDAPRRCAGPARRRSASGWGRTAGPPSFGKLRAQAHTRPAAVLAFPSHAGRGGTASASPMASQIGPGVLEIDTLLGGWERVTAGYLVEGPSPCWSRPAARRSVPALLAALADLGVDARRPGRRRRHPHPPRPRRRRGRRGPGLPERHRLRAREGRPPPGRPERLVTSAAMVYGDLLDSLYGRLDPTPAERVHVLEDGEEIAGRPDRDADHRRLARPRQAPPRPARLRERDPVRRRRGRRAPARRRRPAAGDAAARLRPRPGPRLARPVRRRAPDRHRAGPLRARARRRRRPRRGHGHLRQWAEVAEAAWSEGRDIAAALDEAFAGELAASTRPTGRSSRRSTASTPTPPGSGAGSTSGPKPTGTPTPTEPPHSFSWVKSGLWPDFTRGMRDGKRRQPVVGPGACARVPGGGRRHPAPHRGRGRLFVDLPERVERVLDLGTGDGRLLALVLTARPGRPASGSTSPTRCSTRARERFDGDDRVEIGAHDLDDPLPDAGTVRRGRLELRHPPRGRRPQAGAVRRGCAALRPGGVFLNLEHVASPTGRAARAVPGRPSATTQADDDPSNLLAPVEDQLGWLRDVGFVDVDCHWKWLELALAARGVKPER